MTAFTISRRCCSQRFSTAAMATRASIWRRPFPAGTAMPGPTPLSPTCPPRTQNRRTDMPQPLYRAIESDVDETVTGEVIDQTAEEMPVPTWFRQHSRTNPDALPERYRSLRTDPVRYERESRRGHVAPPPP